MKNALAPFLPVPVVRKLGGQEGEGFTLDYDFPRSIGRLHANFGNVGMLVRAYAYIRSLGPDGLRRCAEMAVLNANYLLARLRGVYHVPYDRPVMHECVLSDRHLDGTGVTTLDVAKRLIDYGYHPPTVYFPLIVHGALMIEPTESESLEGLDRFVDALLAIAEEAREDPELVRTAPHHTRRSRLDETRAARQPVLRWQPEEPALAPRLLLCLVALAGCVQDDGTRFNPIRDLTHGERRRRAAARHGLRSRAPEARARDRRPGGGRLPQRSGPEDRAARIEPQPFIYRFRVIDDPSLNAFAVPGGYVYFHSGTLLAAGSVDELAGVMGHEIAHVKARHYARMQKASQLPDLLAGIAGMAAAVAAREPGHPGRDAGGERRDEAALQPRVRDRGGRAGHDLHDARGLLPGGDHALLRAHPRRATQLPPTASRPTCSRIPTSRPASPP